MGMIEIYIGLSLYVIFLSIYMEISVWAGGRK